MIGVGERSDVTDLVTEGRALVERGNDRGVSVRMLGGIAIAMRCPSASAAPFARAYSDLDAVIPGRDRKQIDALASDAGLAPDKSFNAVNGKHRRIYKRDDGLKLDVFIEEFSMCHEIPLEADRLALDSATVPLAELLLTKAQIVELNRKDAHDLFVLFFDHDLSDDDRGISVTRINELCGAGWGLWRTVTGTLEALEEATATIEVGAEDRALVRGRVERLVEEMRAAPKSRKWKMRAKVGDRVQWYTMPEEPNVAVNLLDA
jgi:hypothetical protein